MVPISYSPFIRMEGHTISESYADKTEIFYDENGEVIDVKMTALQSLVTADIPCGGTGDTPFTYVTEVKEEVDKNEVAAAIAQGIVAAFKDFFEM